MYTLAMSTEKDSVTNVMIGVILTLIVVIVAVQQLTLPTIDVSMLPKEGEACKGEPIYVDYEYGGEMMSPHECAMQCEDQIWRHIVYTNNVGTQCQLLPGCSDWGEDSNITCVPQSDQNSAR